MRIAKIKYTSLAEGPRKNTTIWTAGCSFHCPGCFNRELWDKASGNRYALHEILAVIRTGRSLGDKGVAFVGGEPMQQPWRLLMVLIARRLIFPKQIVTIYSGYHLNQLLKHPARFLALWFTDILVDGLFLPELAKDKPNYRGSSNQRVIRLKPTRRRLFSRVVEANWENLIGFTGHTISAPVKFSRVLNLTEGGEIDHCGKH